MIAALLLACVIDEARSPTPTLRWDRNAVCPCAAGCREEDGYRIFWALSEQGAWTLLVTLPCTPAFDELGDDGITNVHHPKWCWGVDKAVPVSRWLPSTPAGTTVYFRPEPYRKRDSGQDAVSCLPSPSVSICWPLIREIPAGPR